ncbi:F-box/FBD/LRR-repeat protein [Camellia lanceoleosa]|uniref:F-box/FBD/LRR-repeat protein n=1 Tax=Camellia lanceoleosa TaxID=1840588 RepID=A0ACC0I9L7_9ERIC|nr:F-box/FBD/LRR-repeat protein [Camellia lanceoleosa]
MKRNTNEVRGSTSDIISNLPGSIKETILVCLPIQDAVRTSVLSTKWRYIWTKLPQLVFDDNFCRESARKSKTELMMTIYQVLLLHRGPIPKFILNLSRLESCPEMDQLILFLSNNGIQEFTLLIEKGEPYKLPSSFFSCEQLRYLSLRSCVFKSPPEFKGFSRLLKLVLHRVFVASDTLSSLISSCPLLEELSLKRSFISDCLEINAPNLRFLVCCEIYGSSICLKNTARLARVSICYFMGIFNVEGITQAETSKLVTLFGSLPVIEFLLLEYHTIQYMSAGGVPKRLPTTLNNLKTLKLLSICFEEVNEISVILCLIRSSPNLEKITIVVRRWETADVIDHVLQLLEMQDWSDVSLNQLQVVELGNLSGTQSELKFIELLLAISPVLETMFIQTDSERVADKGLRILTEVTRFPRWSSHAEIKFEYRDKDQV